MHRDRYFARQGAVLRRWSGRPYKLLATSPAVVVQSHNHRAVRPWGHTTAVAALLTASIVQAQDLPRAQPEAPPITCLRHNEDYSYLREPQNRSGAWWEPYKFIPLDPSAFAYVTFGNEARLRIEHYWNNEFGAGPKPTEGYLWLRDLPYADLHIGPSFRAFGQLIVAHAARSELTKGPVDETGVDLLRAFVDWRIPLSNEGAATLRAGRQILIYGSERLISARYGPNVLRSFDGALGRWEEGEWRADAFFCPPR